VRHTGRKGQYFPTGRFDPDPSPETGTLAGEKKKTV
jgi:hypothetical protein